MCKRKNKCKKWLLNKCKQAIDKVYISRLKDWVSIDNYKLGIQIMRARILTEIWEKFQRID